MTCETWPIVWTCDKPVGLTPEQEAAAIAAAQTMLWARTGRRLGLCTVVEEYAPVGGGSCGVPYMTDDLVWHNGGRGGSSCCAINLLQLPAQSVESVTVNGAALDPAGYVLAAGQLLRVGGCWPAADQCGGFPVRVAYTWGMPVTGSPLEGLVAAAMGEVAAEVAQGLCGGVCKLPSRAVSISRQGVTVELGAPGEWMEHGLLGLPLADALIDTVNPGRKRQRSRVFSPDLPGRRRVVTP